MPVTKTPETAPETALKVDTPVDLPVDTPKNGDKKDKPETATVMAPVKPATKRTLALHAILNDVGQGEQAASILDAWAEENPVSVNKG